MIGGKMIGGGGGEGAKWYGGKMSPGGKMILDMGK